MLLRASILKMKYFRSNCYIDKYRKACSNNVDSTGRTKRDSIV